MNGYLVVISCSMDDVPVRLFASRSFAHEFAAIVDADEAAEAAFEKRNYLGSDAIAVRIQQFADGVCVSDQIVRDLEDEEEGGAS